MSQKTLLVLAILGALTGCHSWPAMHADVVELRAINKTRREHTTAKSVSETAQVEALEVKIDGILGHLEALTK